MARARPQGHDDVTFTEVEAGTCLSGRYRLDQRLGAGGMGVVWRARHLDLQVDVAVKLLPPELAADEDATYRLIREAKKLARLDHPHVARVTDCGVDPDVGGEPVAYVVMEFLAGPTLLDHLLRRRRLSPGEVAWIVGTLAEALDHAHGKRLVHRDVKPGNVMFTGPVEDDSVGGAGATVKLIDFGLAGEVQDTVAKSGLTLPGQVDAGGGTPAYMSPEQIRGRRPAPAMDIWALAVMTYQMLADRLPFPGPSAMLRRRQILDFDPEPLDELADEDPELAARLDAVLARGLAKDPAERFVSAGDFHQALEAALGGTGPEPEPGPAAEPASGPTPRRGDAPRLEPAPDPEPRAHAPPRAARPPQGAAEVQVDALIEDLDEAAEVLAEESALGRDGARPVFVHAAAFLVAGQQGPDMAEVREALQADGFPVRHYTGDRGIAAFAGLLQVLEEQGGDRIDLVRAMALAIGALVRHVGRGARQGLMAELARFGGETRRQAAAWVDWREVDAAAHPPGERPAPPPRRRRARTRPVPSSTPRRDAAATPRPDPPPTDPPEAGWSLPDFEDVVAAVFTLLILAVPLWGTTGMLRKAAHVGQLHLEAHLAQRPVELEGELCVTGWCLEPGARDEARGSDLPRCPQHLDELWSWVPGPIDYGVRVLTWITSLWLLLFLSFWLAEAALRLVVWPLTLPLWPWGVEEWSHLLPWRSLLVVVALIDAFENESLDLDEVPCEGIVDGLVLVAATALGAGVLAGTLFAWVKW